MYSNLGTVVNGASGLQGVRGPTSFYLVSFFYLSCVSLIKLKKEPPRIDYKKESCSNICLEVAKKPFQSQNIRVGQIVK